jgi:hypothetical protein
VYHTLRQLGNHSRVELNGDDLFARRQQLHCQVPCAWPDLEHLKAPL